MQNQGTALISRPSVTAFASARDAYIARCTADLAEAIATRNVHLLPLGAVGLSIPEPERCPDCHGSGYELAEGEFIICYCIGAEIPGYDFPRCSGYQATITTAGAPAGLARVWVPCPSCGIGQIEGTAFCNGMPPGVPWVADCADCADTGWVFSCYAATADVFAW